MTNKQKILQISKELGLSHIGSCISVLPILEEIYAKKKPEDIVGLGGAHAHLAHLVVMDSYREIAVIEPTDIDHIKHIIEDFGIHCERKAGCDISGGSLGHAGGILIGMALADRNRDVYWIITDGEAGEGSVWEQLRIANELKLDNLKIYTNFNGYTAVAHIDKYQLMARMRMFHPNINYRMTNNPDPFDGVQGHYRKVE